MPSAASDLESVRRELEKVLGSPLFVRTEQLSRLLRFLVERHVEGRDEELKESVIAVEVFGRKPDYDPRRDPIVRTEARRLRARLDDYYSQAAGSQLVIELPKGGYVPRLKAGSGEETPTRAETVESEYPRHAFRLGPWPAMALALVAFTTLGCWFWIRAAKPIPIAVLPLENLNHIAADDYFADGLTEEIIRNLSILDGLAVRSQTSSFVFKGKPRNVRDAAAQLGADYILEGTVLRAGPHLRVNVQLIRAREDSPLWAERYDREVTDVFAIQDEISRGIVNKLRLKLGRGRRRYETSVEAYDLYLRGRELVRHGFSGYRESVPFFEAAIAKDASFAPAYAGLAMDAAIQSGNTVSDSADVLTRMRASSQRAVELDPLSAEAITAQALAYARDARWREAERSFRRAIQLEPHNSTLRNEFAIEFLESQGRTDEALRELRAAEKDDPLSPDVHQRLTNVLIVLGRYEDAAAYATKMPPDSTLRSAWLGRALFFQGRTAEAIQILRLTSEERGYLAFVYGRSGRRAEAEQVAARVDSPVDQAIAFAGMGEKDRAIAALERAMSLGPLRLGRLFVYPEMAFLRGDARVTALRKKLGLPE